MGTDRETKMEKNTREIRSKIVLKRRKLVSYGEFLTCKECGKVTGHRYEDEKAGRKAIEKKAGWDTKKMLCNICKLKDL